MLKTVELKEKYKIINNKVYATIAETGAKRAVDPCDVRVELGKDIDLLAGKKAALEAELAAITKELIEKTQLDSQIAGLGYCKKDKPIYKKIDGITIYDANNKPVVDHYVHQDYCPNKEA